MNMRNLSAARREVLARTIGTLASRTRKPGSIAESVTWIGSTAADDTVPIAVLMGGLRSTSIRCTWKMTAIRSEDAMAAPAALWMRADAETGRILAERGAGPGYYATTSIEDVLAGKIDQASRIDEGERRWALPERLSAHGETASMETRAAQIAEALDRCQHAMAGEKDIRCYLGGIAIGGVENTHEAHMVATDGQQLAVHTLALTGTVQGYWGTRENQNTETVLPRRAIRGLAKTLGTFCKGNPCAEAHITRHGSRILIRLDRDATIEIATIDGHFPDWRRIMPSESREHATKEVRSCDFAAAVRASTAEATRRDCPANGDKPSAEPTAKLRFHEDQIAIHCRPRHTARKGVGAYACTSVAARTLRPTTGELLEIRMDHEQLGKALDACARNGGKTRIEVSYSNKPIVLRSTKSTMVLMPDRWW